MAHSNIAAMLAKRDELRKMAEALDIAIKLMSNGDGEIHPEPRSNDYVGMKKAAAVEKYFRLTGKTRAHLYDEVMPALAAGGMDFVADPTQARKHLRTAMTMNATKFTFDEETGLVTLREAQKKHTA